MQGYNVGTVPASIPELIDTILKDKEAKFDSPTLNIAYRMKVSEYESLCLYHKVSLTNLSLVLFFLVSKRDKLFIFFRGFFISC